MEPFQPAPALGYTSTGIKAGADGGVLFWLPVPMGTEVRPL